MYLYEMICKMLRDEEWTFNFFDAKDDISAMNAMQITDIINQKIQEAEPAWAFAKVKHYTPKQTIFEVRGLPGEWELNFEPEFLKYTIIYRDWQEVNIKENKYD